MLDHKKEKHNDDDLIPEDGLIEDVELENEEETTKEKLKNLKDRLKTTEMEKAINLDGWQRERADFLNFKRRASEEKLKDREVTTTKHIEKLLPFCDSFELALKSITESSAVDANTKNGLRGIATQLRELLNEYGVTQILPKIGDDFDPEQHEALSTIEVEDESEGNTIREVIQTGYSIGNRVIRPARVVVGEYQS